MLIFVWNFCITGSDSLQEDIPYIAVLMAAPPFPFEINSIHCQMFRTRTEHQEDIPYANENSPLAGSGEQKRFTIQALEETWYTQPN